MIASFVLGTYLFIFLNRLAVGAVGGSPPFPPAAAPKSAPEGGRGRSDLRGGVSGRDPDMFETNSPAILVLDLLVRWERPCLLSSFAWLDAMSPAAIRPPVIVSEIIAKVQKRACKKNKTSSQALKPVTKPTN